MDDAVTQRLLDLEHRGWRSMCEGRGGEYYGDLMTDDGLMVLTTGASMSREEVLLDLGGAQPWDGYSIDELRTVPVGHDTVALVYRGTGHRHHDDDVVGTMTSVYVRTGTGWSLALHTQVRLS